MTKIQKLENTVKSIIDKLDSFKDKKCNEKEISSIQKDLHSVDEQWNDGAVKEDDGSIAPGQAEFAQLLNDAHEKVSALLDQL